MTVCVRVALPVHLDRLFDYLPPVADHGSLSAGVRVRVPFRNRTLIGVVTEQSANSDWDEQRLRPVVEVLDNAPLLGDSMLALCRWIARYYHYPIGEVVALALPKLLRAGGSPEVAVNWQLELTEAGRLLVPEQLVRAPRQRQVLAALSNAPLPRTALLALPGVNGPVLKRMMDKGWLNSRPSSSVPVGSLIPGPKLNKQQDSAARAVIAALGSFESFLLDGVTGSGKTEVYLSIISRVIRNGQQSLVIVPEIGLTPQLMARFRQRLGETIGVLHSGLTDRERHAIWVRAANGELDLVLGTRSAIFVSLPNLGLVIVDEEHDSSLKQQDTLRYSARDVAVQRAKMAGVPVLLGSATPSLESLNNALAGRYRHLLLPQRAGGAKPPQQRRIDLRGLHCQEGLSAALVSAMREHLARGEQIMLFLNRRGFSPVLMCDACGWFAECPRCDARLTLHLSERRLRCHHCDRQQGIPGICPSCASTRLEPLGLGTQRLEQRVRQLFPDQTVLRLDRDAVRKKGALLDTLEQVRSGQACILLGTQMLAKGHDFANMTLVGIVNLDQALFSSDFRASERAAQLLVQVSGRAGRADKPGFVYVQTHHPDHPLFGELLAKGYRQYAGQLLLERKAAGFPPCGFLALLRAEAVQREAVINFMGQAAQSQAARINLYGPLPSPMERRAGRYRMQVLVQAASRGELHHFLDQWMERLANLKTGKKVRWSLDVDPQDTF